MTSLNDLYTIFLDCSSVSTDTRKINRGSLFFALKGEKFNGNEFALDALEKGASFAVIDDGRYAVNEKTILVDNALETLQELAKYHRQQFRIPVIAITGTNGKTTTKELIKSVLSGTYKVIATEGNLNNHIGVPLTLLSIKPETQVAVIEMGANHVGEIAFLCEIALPTHGIITNIGKAHLEGFGGIEGVIRAKTELYQYLRSVDGVAFLNKDNAILVKHKKGLRIITYGSDPSAAFTGYIIEQENSLLKVQISFTSCLMTLETKLFGRYNFENVLAAACIGCYFNVPAEQIKDGIENYAPSNNRSQVVNSGKNILIMDAYNANPDSLESAILNFRDSSYPEKTLIMGDMLELGPESDAEHTKILELVEKCGFSGVSLVGPVFTRINTKREWLCFHDSDLARLWFEHHPLTGKTILIKGSRGIRMERIIDVL